MNTKTIKQEIPVTLYIDAVPPSKYDDKEMEQGYGIRVKDFDYAGGNAVRLTQQEVTITVPAGVDVLTGMVDSLKEQQQKIRAEAEVECNAIESQIQSMLCIEYQPEVVA